jgi:hypothetical protein
VFLNVLLNSLYKRTTAYHALINIAIPAKKGTLITAFIVIKTLSLIKENVSLNVLKELCHK